MAMVRPHHLVDRAILAPVPYQLVLQFAGDSLVDYDAMIVLEEQLISALGESADVDGHDCGQGECNLFILTDDPTKTFQPAWPILSRANCSDSVLIAYRDIEEENYAVIWPEDFAGTFTIG